jgi:hypothetical protein
MLPLSKKIVTNYSLKAKNKENEKIDYPSARFNQRSHHIRAEFKGKNAG